MLATFSSSGVDAAAETYTQSKQKLARGKSPTTLLQNTLGFQKPMFHTPSKNIGFRKILFKKHELQFFEEVAKDFQLGLKRVPTSFLKIWDNWSWLYHYQCHKDTPPFYPCTLGFRLACLDEEFLLLQFWVDGDLPVKCPFAVWSHLQLEVFWWWGSLCVQGHYGGTHCAKLSFFVQKF